MAKDLIRRYIWIVDTINRYGRLSREELDRLWMRSHISDGAPIPPRTFFHYRRAIEENFNIEILCNRRGEYYIDKGVDNRNEGMINWLLDSYAVNSAMKESKAPAANVLVEDVPSARDYLPTVLDAIGNSEKICFTYASFSRSRPQENIIFSPFFVKRYKQRWYMIGERDKKGDRRESLRTYALDRIRGLKPTGESFTPPPDLDPSGLFENTIGVTLTVGDVKVVRLRTSPQQAKYFRALPFHHTQQEELGDGYSIFTYKLKINYELVHELLSYGREVAVLAPQSLRVMVANELAASMADYADIPTDSTSQIK